MTEHVLVKDDAGVRQITLARPDKKNALTQAMYAAVIAALEQGDSDPTVRVFCHHRPRPCLHERE
jgi:enoyl-CoA hydratase/carnithine racemase